VTRLEQECLVAVRRQAIGVVWRAVLVAAVLTGVAYLARGE
jgi:hypothetical protein